MGQMKNKSWVFLGCILVNFIIVYHICEINSRYFFYALISLPKLENGGRTSEDARGR